MHIFKSNAAEGVTDNHGQEIPQKIRIPIRIPGAMAQLSVVASTLSIVERICA